MGYNHGGLHSRRYVLGRCGYFGFYRIMGLYQRQEVSLGRELVGVGAVFQGGEMTHIHIFRTDNIKRIRMRCPYCKILCYGNRHDYYHGSYVFFDCGTQINNEGWRPPPKKKCPYCPKGFRPLDMIKHLREYHKISHSRG